MLDADGYYDLLDLSCAMHASCYGRQGDCNLCQCDYALASRALEVRQKGAVGPAGCSACVCHASATRHCNPAPPMLQIIAAEHVGEACYASAGDASATQSARVAAAIKLYSGALYSLSACPETCKDGDSLDPNDETGCDSTWLFNTAFTGTAVSAYPNGYIAAAPAECCQLCTDDPECRAFTFDYLGSTCYMFLGDYQTSFESQAMVSGVWLGPTFEDPVATAAACPADNWEVMQDLDLVGGDLRRDAYVSTDTWEKCCAICALPNTACYGW